MITPKVVVAHQKSGEPICRLCITEESVDTAIEHAKQLDGTTKIEIYELIAAVEKTIVWSPTHGE